MKLCHIYVPLAYLVFTVGCQQSVDPPSVDSEDAAAKAIKTYDKDGNGSLSETELAASPGLLAMVDSYDATGDKEVSHDEIVARLEAMYSGRVALTTTRCKVTLDRRPLAGARVRYVPERFLGDAIEAAEGVTDRAGFATIAIPDEQLPEDLAGLGGLQLGIYRVKITHASLSIPAKYNSQTTLGCEVYPAKHDDSLVFSLQSR